MRSSSRIALVFLVAAAAAGCGGGGGGGGEAGGLLPLLEEDALVSLMSPDTTSNELISCNAGSRIYVAWVERSNVVPDAVLFNRSLDGGATWLAAPVVVSEPDLVSSSAAICCDGDLVYVVYASFVNGASEIRLNRSLDAGTTFLDDDVIVSDVLGQDGFTGSPAACCEGLTVHVAWEDSRDGSRDVYYHSSVDGGVTFPGTDTRLDTDPPGAADSRQVDVCCDGSRVYVAWTDSRAGGDDVAVRLNRSVDGGVTFLANDIPVSQALTDTIDPSRPDVECEGDTVVVVWADLRNGEADVFVNRSVDAGLAFLATDVRPETDGPGATASFGPDACLEDGVLHVAWSDGRPGSPVRYNRSEDLGATFLAQDVPLGSVPPVGTESGDVRIACEGSTLVVAWESSPPLGETDILLVASADGGQSFEEARADTDPPGVSLSFNPTIALSGDRFAIVWGEVRDGLAQVRVNRTR